MDFCHYCGKLTKMQLKTPIRPVCIQHINELIANQRTDKNDFELITTKEKN